MTKFEKIVVSAYTGVLMVHPEDITFVGNKSKEYSFI